MIQPIFSPATTVYLLDASIYLFRAWFGVPDRFHDAKGRPLNALYGYFRQLLQRYHPLQPQYMLAAFDESLFTGFRHQVYPLYKANRALPDEALAHQMRLCREVTEVMGIPCVSDTVYEADDLLAWGAQTAHRQGLSCVVISRDKDLAQILSDTDNWWDWSQPQAMSRGELQQKWGIPLETIPDLLALAGDAVDNIPGARGIGVKTAQALIAHYGDLDTLFAQLDDLTDLPIRGAKRIQTILAAAEQDLYLFRELIRLRAPNHPLPLSDLSVSACDWDSVRTWVQEEALGPAFLSLLDRFRVLTD